MDLLEKYSSVLEDSPGARFRVFSRHGVPLLLLPEDRETAGKTIGLYLPQSATARIARSALSFLNGAGLLDLLPSVTAPGVGNGRPCGYLLCNPVHGARAVEVRAADGGGFNIRKTAVKTAAAPIRAEFDALRRLQGRPGVPAVFGLNDGATVSFDMEFLGQSPVRGLEDERIESMLEAWRSPDDPREALVHGDFAMWNIRGRCGEPVAIDWEWSVERGRAGFDLVYALVREATLLHHLDGGDVRDEVVRRVGRSEWMMRHLSKSGFAIDDLLDEVGVYIESRSAANQ